MGMIGDISSWLCNKHIHLAEHVHLCNAAGKWKEEAALRRERGFGAVSRPASSFA